MSRAGYPLAGSAGGRGGDCGPVAGTGLVPPAPPAAAIARRDPHGRPAVGGRVSDSFRRPARTAVLGRLLWQHWRQSIGVMASLAGFVVGPRDSVFGKRSILPID